MIKPFFYLFCCYTVPFHTPLNNLVVAGDNHNVFIHMFVKSRLKEKRRVYHIYRIP